MFASPPRALLKGDRVAEAVVVVVKEERWMDKVTARPLSYRQPAVASTPPTRRAALTMTATRAIVTPLIDASLTPPTAAHTPIAHRNTRLSERERKRRMVRNGGYIKMRGGIGGLGGKEGGKRGGEWIHFGFRLRERESEL